jgi:uncharacterized membrane protein YidH (DUF202 family)
MDTAVGRTAEDRAASKGLVGDKAPNIDSNYGVNFYSGDDDDGGDVDIISDEDGCVGWMFPFCSGANDVDLMAPTSVQKIEPKVFFANERTFLHWLHHGVILSSIASGILAFSKDEGLEWSIWYALFLLPVSLGFCVYALHTFLWRADRIRSRIPGRWDDPSGPLALGGIIAAMLTVNFLLKLYAIAVYDGEIKHA